MYLGIDVVSKFGFGAIIWFSRWTIGFMVDMLSYLIGSHKSTYNWGHHIVSLLLLLSLNQKHGYTLVRAGKGDISITSSMIIAVVIIYS